MPQLRADTARSAGRQQWTGIEIAAVADECEGMARERKWHTNAVDRDSLPRCLPPARLPCPWSAAPVGHGVVGRWRWVPARCLPLVCCMCTLTLMGALLLQFNGAPGPSLNLARSVPSGSGAIVSLRSESAEPRGDSVGYVATHARTHHPNPVRPAKSQVGCVERHVETQNWVFFPSYLPLVKVDRRAWFHLNLTEAPHLLRVSGLDARLRTRRGRVIELPGKGHGMERALYR